MICIFDKSASKSSIITSNGEAILDRYCMSCTTEEQLFSGEYYLDATFTSNAPFLNEENIIKVTMDYGEEYFKIARVRQTPSAIEVFARQITMADTLDLWLDDVRVVDKGGQESVSWLLSNASGKKDITLYSNINVPYSAYYVRMSLYQALHDCDNSFMNSIGGEIQRRGYTLAINDRIGSHRGVQIRSGKNLTGFESNVDMDSVVTRIKPIGFDGITINGYVDSPYINHYATIKTREIKYEQVKVRDENTSEDEVAFDTLEEAQQELVRLASLEFSQRSLDKPLSEYVVNFIQLEDTQEYMNYVQAERVYIGDTLNVIESTYGLNITVRAISKTYDVLAQRVLELGLSNGVKAIEPPTLGDVLDKIEGLEPVDVNDILEQAKQHATDLINAGLKDSYVVVRPNEILVMDTKDINTATNVWRWNKGGLGFSSTGYNGEYGLALTNDGQIVADMITTGVLNGELIDVGTILADRLDVNTQKKINESVGITQVETTVNTALEVYDGEIKLEVSEMIDTSIESVNQTTQEIIDDIARMKNDNEFTPDERAKLKVELDRLQDENREIRLLVQSINNDEVTGYYDGVFSEAWYVVMNFYMQLFDGVHEDEIIYIDYEAFHNALQHYMLQVSTLDALIKQVYGANITTMSSELNVAKEGIEMVTSKVTQVEGVTNDISRHFNFTHGGWVEIFASLNGQPGRFKTQITDQKLAFSDNGQEVAYISNQKLYIKDAEVTNQMTIGNFVLTKSSSGGIIFR